MKLVVTGANGFIGKNLCATLQAQHEYELLKVTRQTSPEELERYLAECDFVFHLAGVNRPKDEGEFFIGNTDFTAKIVRLLGERRVPILYASSTQVDNENSYGKSKKRAESILRYYSEMTDASIYVYRLTNIYGKWSRPNYNSVVATFCYNIARGLPIRVDDPDRDLTLCYIDNVVEEFQRVLTGSPTIIDGCCAVPITHTIKIGELSRVIGSFRASRENLSIPTMSNLLEKNLYSTYLSFLPENEFNYPLKMNHDNRGSFTEFIRTEDRGQVSINISKPGITKGNHWHHSKNEKFLVVSGIGVIRFRRTDCERVIEYYVSGEKLEVVDIPTGYAHHIENLGDSDLVTIMWANECFNPASPDTYFLEV